MPSSRRLAEEELLRRLPTATPDEREALQELFLQWGFEDDHLTRLRRARPWQRADSALVLARMQVREALPAILALLRHPNRELRLAALRAVELLGDPDAIEPLVKVLPEVKHTAWRMVWAALIACARAQPERLLAHISHPDVRVREVVAAVLAEVAPPEVLVELLVHPDDPEPEVRAKRAWALGRSGSPRALPVLARWTQDPVWYVRLRAVGALGALGDRSAHEFLLPATRDSHIRVRQKSASSLYLLWGDPIYLIDLLRQQVPDRYALEALVSELEWRGVAWEAINSVTAPVAGRREQSRELVRHFLSIGACTSVLYAVEMHPDLALRHALLELVGEALPTDRYLDLVQVLASPYLDAGTRRAVEKLVAFPGNADDDLG